jgi:hypothetical protein
MKVHLFRGEGRVFGCTGESEGRNLPARYGPWAAFKSLELERGQSQPGLDVEACLDDLERYGVHVTDAHVRITEQAMD